MDILVGLELFEIHDLEESSHSHHLGMYRVRSFARLKGHRLPLDLMER
jgi:hypothetical protein